VKGERLAIVDEMSDLRKNVGIFSKMPHASASMRHQHENSFWLMVSLERSTGILPVFAYHPTGETPIVFGMLHAC
jgi:hypothetical protein